MATLSDNFSNLDALMTKLNSVQNLSPAAQAAAMGVNVGNIPPLNAQQAMSGPSDPNDIVPNNPAGYEQGTFGNGDLMPPEVNGSTAAPKVPSSTEDIPMPPPGTVAFPSTGKAGGMQPVSPNTAVINPAQGTPASPTGIPGQAPKGPNFMQRYLSGIESAYSNGNNGTGLGNAVGAALAPVTNTVSEAGNAVGGALHGITAPLLNNSDGTPTFLNKVLGAYGKASATAPIGMATQQLYGLFNGVTGNNVDTPYNFSTNANGNGGTNGNMIPTSQDAIISQLNATKEMWTPVANTPGPMQANAQNIVEKTNQQLDNAYTQQAKERANTGGLGLYANGSADMQELANLGQTSYTMHKYMTNLQQALEDAAKGTPGSSQEILAAYGAVAKDENLMEEIKRQNPNLAANIESTYSDGLYAGLEDKNGYLVPGKISGAVQGLYRAAASTDGLFYNKLHQSGGNQKQIDTVGQRLNSYYNQPYFQTGTGTGTGTTGPLGPDTSGDIKYLNNVLQPNGAAMSNASADATSINKETAGISGKNAAANKTAYWGGVLSMAASLLGITPSKAEAMAPNISPRDRNIIIDIAKNKSHDPTGAIMRGIRQRYGLK